MNAARFLAPLVPVFAAFGISAGEHIVSGSMSYDSNACPAGLNTDESTLAYSGAYTYTGEKTDASAEVRHGPSGADCRHDSNAFDFNLERRLSLGVAYALVNAGHERHGVVDRWGPRASNLATGSYQADQLGIGVGSVFGPLLVEVSYNGLDEAHPLYLEIGLDGPAGSRLAADIRCPVGGYTETPSLAYECFAETEVSIQRDFQDSRFGVEFFARYIWNYDSLSGHYSWSDCGVVEGMSVCPGLPSDNVSLGATLTAKLK